jgi:hypothetical protein
VRKCSIIESPNKIRITVLRNFNSNDDDGDDVDDDNNNTLLRYSKACSHAFSVGLHNSFCSPLPTQSFFVCVKIK